MTEHHVSRELLTWLDKLALLMAFVLVVCVAGIYVLGVSLYAFGSHNHALLIHLLHRSTVCPAPPGR